MEYREDIYEEYKASDDKEIVIDGETYYKIIDIYKLVDYNMIMLPSDIFRWKSSTLMDEKGNVFKVGAPMHCSFRGKAPEWYMHTLSFPIWETKPEEIGSYVRLVEEN